MSICVVRPQESLLLSLMIQQTERKGTFTYIKVFREWAQEQFTLPLAFALEQGLAPAMRAPTRSFWPFHGEFQSEEQKKAFDDALVQLGRTRTCILALHVGFGKTFLALRLMAHLGMKTLIVIPTSKKVLQAQWIEALERFLPTLQWQQLQSSSQVDWAKDVFIVGSQSVIKLASQLHTIPLVLVDELHLVLSAKGFQSLLCVQPQFLLGLSATPFRLDGSDRLISLFFGTVQISKSLERNFKVHILHTPYTYTVETTEAGTVNWGGVLLQQAECEARNALIIEIMSTFRALKFLVLCKRVYQIKDLATRAKDAHLDVQAVYDDMTPVKDHRSLIGSIQKLGVGFSDASFEALILGSDAQNYFIQYLGRILRTPDARPMVFDLVDACFLMRRHFEKRRTVYEDTGATIQNWSLEQFRRKMLRINELSVSD